MAALRQIPARRSVTRGDKNPLGKPCATGKGHDMLTRILHAFPARKPPPCPSPTRNSRWG
jgi:hypothetical protein